MENDTNILTTIKEEPHDDLSHNINSSNDEPSSSSFQDFVDEAFDCQWEDDDLLDLSCVKSEPQKYSDGRLKSPICISTIAEQFTSTYISPQTRSMRVPTANAHTTDHQQSTTIDDLPRVDQFVKRINSPDSGSTDHRSADSQLNSSSCGDLEWEDENEIKHQKAPHVSAKRAPVSPEHWRTVTINGQNYKLDMDAIQPYRQILSHGGYHGDGLCAIVVFSACYLPKNKTKNIRYILDNLFLYIVSTLDLLVAHEYLIVFFASGCNAENRPPYSWLKKCYKLLSRRLRKSLQQFIIVHPSFQARLMINFLKPFLSSKINKKLKFAGSLHQLADKIPVDDIQIPDRVQQHDVRLVNRKCEKVTGHKAL